MYDKNFTGMILSATGKVDTKSEDQNDGNIRIKLECANINIDSMREFNPAIAQIIETISPIPFETCGFGDQSRIGINIGIKSYSQDLLPDMPDIPEFVYKRVMFTNLDVKVKENIPVYVFTIDIPFSNSDIKQLFKFLKINISFYFTEGTFSDEVD